MALWGMAASSAISCNTCTHNTNRWLLMLASDTCWKSVHDDVIKWKHFPRYWPFVREIHRSPVNFLHKGQWRGALMFSLIYAWINDWVNNREAGDLRRQHGHYDVIVVEIFGRSVSSSHSSHAYFNNLLLNNAYLNQRYLMCKAMTTFDHHRPNSSHFSCNLEVFIKASQFLMTMLLLIGPQWSAAHAVC